MFNSPCLRLTLVLFISIILLGCDSHPTTKSNYINKSYDGFTIAEIEWKDIPLKQVISNHYKIASEKNQKVFIQITAEWCSPCKRLRKKSEEPLLQKAYQGTYIIRLDRDEWGKDFAEIGIKKTPIPIFWELGGTEVSPKVTKYVLDGNYWKEITAEALSPIFKAYFSGSARPFLIPQKPKTNNL